MSMTPRATRGPGTRARCATCRELRRQDIRALDEHMEATLREMGVTYGLPQGDQAAPWMCDLLPHVFTVAEWQQVTAGVSQRIRAFELFLQDMYGKREILRDGIIPVHPVLGSPHYEAASIGLPLPGDAYLHLSGICLTRNANGQLAVKEHHISRAAGHLLHDPEPARAGQRAAGFVRAKRRQLPGGYPLAGRRGAAGPRRSRPGTSPRPSCSPRGRRTPSTPSTASSPGAWASRWSRGATSSCWTITFT